MATALDLIPREHFWVPELRTWFMGKIFGSWRLLEDCWPSPD